jgi:hypothetical protein
VVFVPSLLLNCRISFWIDPHRFLPLHSIIRYRPFHLRYL